MLLYTYPMFGERTKLPNANNADVGILIAIMLAVAFAASWALLGFWEAVRGVAIEALILAVTFSIARQWLPWEDAPRERIQFAGPELFVAFFGFVFFYVAWPFFSGINDIEGSFINGMFSNALLGIMVVTSLIAFRHPRSAWGLRWPTGREALVALAIAAVTIGVSWLVGGILPQSEELLRVGPARPIVPGTLMWAIGGAAALGNPVLPILVFIFALSVIGQELFFRVFLQTRLAHFLPGRWALFVQAVLYYAIAFIPFYILTGGALENTFLLTQVAALSNGILAGYFWRKTGSLPLLVLLHVLAFSRWGL